MVQRSTRLRKLLRGDKIIVAPGAFDALSATLIEQSGFPAIYITGAGVASSRLGVPDIGLVTMTEVLETAKNIINATTVPVICDIDTGHGNALNLMRTVREFENIGIAGLQVEDQITPKRCGHTDGKQLISKEEMVKKIEAFQNAKQSEELVLIARTDAIAVNSFEDAIDRAKAYIEAGADVLFIEAPRSISEMKRIAEIFQGTPLLINNVEGGKTPLLPVEELDRMGFRIAIYPTSAWMSALKAMQGVLRELKERGSTSGYLDRMVSFEEMFEIVGLSKYRALENKYLTL
ncbi:MAG TPA: oxaloacetate decarboxylase [Desulfobacterales bacterium]|nr:oxaloacetate decarboxylase [Desulfobacterales bacterium]